MRVTCIQELLANTSAPIQSAHILVGAFSAGKLDRKDCLFFSDSTGSLPCLILRANHEDFTGPVMLLVWTLASYWPGNSKNSTPSKNQTTPSYYLEIKSLIPSDSSIQDLHSFHPTRKEIQELKKNRRRHVPEMESFKEYSNGPLNKPEMTCKHDQNETLDKSEMTSFKQHANKSLDISGTLVSKSNYIASGSHIFFCTTFECILSAKDKSALNIEGDTFKIKVFFKGENSQSFSFLAAYELLIVNSPFLLTDLVPAKIKFDPQEAPNHGLMYNIHTSKIYLLDQNLHSVRFQAVFSQANLQACIQSQTQEKQSCSQVFQSQTDESQGSNLFRNSTGSYKGEITRILDVNAGIYEIDSTFCLYLTWYPLQNQGLGFKIGAVLSLSNIHIISHILNQRTFLLACPSSTVRLDSFSSSREIYKLENTKFRRKYLERCKGLNFIDMMHQLEIESRLGPIYSHIPQLYQYERLKIRDTILKECGHSSFEWAQTQGVLNHQSCDLACSKYSSFVIDTVASLRAVGDSFDGDDLVSGFQSSIFQPSDWTHYNPILLGWITINRIGYYEMCDDTSKIHIVFISSNQTAPHSFLNRLCLLRNYQIVTEKLESLKSKFIYIQIFSDSITVFGQKGELEENGQINKSEFYFTPHVIHSPSIRLNPNGSDVNGFIEGPFISTRHQSANKYYDQTLYIRISPCAFEQSHIVRTGLVYRMVILNDAMKLECKDAFVADWNANSIFIQDITTSVNQSGTSILDLFFKRNSVDDSYLSVNDVSRHFKDTLHVGKTEIISMQGVINFKELVPMRNEKIDLFRTSCVDIQRKLGSISFESHEVKIYLIDSNGTRLLINFESPSIIGKLMLIVVPLGLLPGAIVKLRNITVQLDASGNIFGTVVHCSQILISKSFGKWTQPLSKAMSTETSTLLNVALSQSLGCVNIRCSIASIDKITFNSKCSICSSLLLSANCPNGCLAFVSLIEVIGSCIVEDGTLKYYVQILSLDLIFRIFKLSVEQKEALQKLTESCGTWTFSSYKKGYSGLNESQIDAIDWLKDICDSRPWQRQLRISGYLSKLPIDSFHEMSPSCIKSSALLRVLTVKDLAGIPRSIASIRRIYFKAESLSEIDALHESNIALEQLGM